MNFKFILLLITTLIFKQNDIYASACASDLPLVDASPSLKTVSAPLSDNGFWERMWLSDFERMDQAKVVKAKQCGINTLFSLKQRKEFLEKAAIYGDVEAMYAMAQLHVEGENYVEALRWYVLTFEEQWMKTSEHDQRIVQILQGRLAANGAPFSVGKRTLEQSILESLSDQSARTEYTELFRSFNKNFLQTTYHKKQPLKVTGARYAPRQQVTRVIATVPDIATQISLYPFLSESEKVFRHLRFLVKQHQMKTTTIEKDDASA